MSHEYREQEESKVVLDDVSYDTFVMILKYIYNDTIPIDMKLIYDILSLVDRFGFDDLKQKCEYSLTQYINVDTVCHIFKYANTFNCERLKESCLLYTEQNYNEVIDSAGFEELDKDEILKIIRVGKKEKKK